MYPVTKKTWNASSPSCTREDLILYDYALEKGFRAQSNKKLTMGLVPADCLSFHKNDVVIWAATLDGWHWRSADLIKGRFKNHRSYETLKQALDTKEVD